MLVAQAHVQHIVPDLSTLKDKVSKQLPIKNTKLSRSFPKFAAADRVAPKIAMPGSHCSSNMFRWCKISETKEATKKVWTSWKRRCENSSGISRTDSWGVFIISRSTPVRLEYFLVEVLSVAFLSCHGFPVFHFWDGSIDFQDVNGLCRVRTSSLVPCVSNCCCISKL